MRGALAACRNAALQPAQLLTSLHCQRFCVPPQGHKDLALLLVQRGAPTLVGDMMGITPLCGAASGGIRAALVAEAAKGKRCAVCGAGGKLKKCSGCHTVRYCGADCQRAHWPDHRRTCRKQE